VAAHGKRLLVGVQTDGEGTVHFETTLCSSYLTAWTGTLIHQAYAADEILKTRIRTQGVKQQIRF
jgi:hypothetical protein